MWRDCVGRWLWEGLCRMVGEGLWLCERDCLGSLWEGLCGMLGVREGLCGIVGVWDGGSKGIFQNHSSDHRCIFRGRQVRDEG